MRPTALAAGAALLALLAGAIGRCSVMRPAGPSRDSLALVAAADSLRAARVVAAAALARADASAQGAAAALAYADSSRRARHGVTLPPRPGPEVPCDSALPRLWERVDSLESQLARAEVELDSATASAHGYREAHREAVAAASLLLAQATAAEGRLNQAAARIGALEDHLRRARNGAHLGLGMAAIGAGEGWATVTGPALAIRRTVLGLEAEASLTAGLGFGGGLAGASTGPGIAIALRVGF